MKGVLISDKTDVLNRYECPPWILAVVFGIVGAVSAIVFEKTVL
jgi:hypothetical protein